MKVRGFAVIVAVLLAVAATTAVYLYVQGVRHQAVKTTPSNSVTVIVPKEDIPAGTQMDKLIAGGGFITLSIPSNAVVAGAVTDLSQIKGKTTRYPILQGEQITSARLEGSSLQPAGGILGIPVGHEAVTISLEPQRLVDGFVQAGDHVVVYATISASGQGTL